MIYTFEIGNSMSTTKTMKTVEHIIVEMDLFFAKQRIKDLEAVVQSLLTLVPNDVAPVTCALAIQTVQKSNKI